MSNVQISGEAFRSLNHWMFVFGDQLRDSASALAVSEAEATQSTPIVTMELLRRALPEAYSRMAALIDSDPNATSIHHEEQGKARVA